MYDSAGTVMADRVVEEVVDDLQELSGPAFAACGLEVDFQVDSLLFRQRAQSSTASAAMRSRSQASRGAAASPESSRAKVSRDSMRCRMRWACAGRLQDTRGIRRQNDRGPAPFAFA